MTYRSICPKCEDYISLVEQQQDTIDSLKNEIEELKRPKPSFWKRLFSSPPKDMWDDAVAEEGNYTLVRYRGAWYANPLSVEVLIGPHASPSYNNEWIDVRSGDNLSYYLGSLITNYLRKLNREKLHREKLDRLRAVLERAGVS